MIKVFQAKDTYFASNGDKIINPYKAVVFKEDNGDYYCEVEAQIELLDYLKQDMILCVQTPWGWQAFRCDKPQRSGNKIWVKAWHLYYDTENYVVASENIVNEGCQAALNQLKGGCDSTLPFSVVSDIADKGSLNCKLKSFAEAVDNVLEVWGGHLERDNFNIGIKSTIGQDRGVTLAYGKNIKEITAEENWDNVCTKILPVGRDEVTTGFLTSSVQYDVPYTKVVEFSQDIDQLEGEDDAAYTARLQADLKVRAEQYLADHALPEVNYKLKAHLQEVADVGDTIWVKHPKCQVDVETHVISVKWDAIKGEYKEIEFGNFRKKLSGLNSMVTAEIKKAEKTTESFVNEELRKATDKIMGAFGNSYVIYDGDKILVLDKLPKEEAKNVIRINSAGIGFSSDGINGTFNSAWLIDGTFDAQKVNVINLSADAITAGTLAAERVGTGSFNMTGGSINIVSNEDHSAIILLYEDESTGNKARIQISASMISFNLYEATTGKTYVTQMGADGVSAPSVFAEDFYMSGYHLSNWFAESDHDHAGKYADYWHDHSEYYGYGDSATFGGLKSTGQLSVDGGTFLHTLPRLSTYTAMGFNSSDQLGYEGSSRRWKIDIEDVAAEELDPQKLYELPVRQFRYDPTYFDDVDAENNPLRVGFIAEEVAEKYPQACRYDAKRLPMTWEARDLIPPMLQLLQEQKKEIEALKERVDALEKGAV